MIDRDTNRYFIYPTLEWVPKWGRERKAENADNKE